MILPRSAGPLTVGEALAPIATMLGLFLLGTFTIGLSGELLVAVLLAAAAVAGLVAARHGKGWAAIQHATGEKLAEVLPAILILLAIGMLISTWVLGGTIPYLVYWGVQFISPRWLVLTAFLATALMSLATGTSWGSAGTIGVALMGTAGALGAPMAATAGAVVSGAYFGDKMSPLSDSTNICAIGAGADLYEHIRHMMYTAVPSFLLAFALYAFASRLLPVPDAAAAATAAGALLTDLERVFVLSPLVLVPPAIVVISIVRRVPPALAIAASSLVAMVLGVWLQGFGMADSIRAAVAGFQLPMLASAGTDPATVGSDFARLVERG
jgi:NhaC family Na+:H+ antiporter